MTQPTPDRLRTATQAIVQSSIPDYVYRGTYEATVLSVIPGPPVAVSCTPTSARYQAILSPILANVTLWADSGGWVCIPSVGSRVRIGFVASGATWLPAIVGTDPLVPPTRIQLPGPAVASLPLTIAPPLLALLTGLNAWVIAVQSSLAGVPATAPAAAALASFSTAFEAIIATQQPLIPAKIANAI